MSSSQETLLVTPVYRCLICVMVGLALVATSGGCLITHSKESVIRQTETRQHVEFESPLARRAFLQRALDNEARLRNKSSHSFAVPFLIGLSYTSELSENAYYNDQLMTCDANSDGLISDAEADAFVLSSYPTPTRHDPAYPRPINFAPALLPPVDTPSTGATVRQ
jgi:hypothetical protein